MMKEVSSKADFIALEHDMLKFWEDEDIFNKLRAQNAGNQHWSFLDGPITANNPMGVHHAWGRTYKDLYQRFHAMLGKELRYQNGFDCQGLWVEVEVEKELGFKSKTDIEAGRKAGCKTIFLDDLTGQVFTLFILTVAAAEAAIGLAIIVVYYRNSGTIRVEEIDKLKG